MRKVSSFSDIHKGDILSDSSRFGGQKEYNYFVVLEASSKYAKAIHLLQHSPYTKEPEKITKSTITKSGSINSYFLPYTFIVVDRAEADKIRHMFIELTFDKKVEKH
jgi:hypothetical protein